MRKLSFVLAGLVLLAPISRSDVLQKSRVPAAARWIAHVDVERLARSELFAALTSEAAGADMKLDFGDIDDLCGLDPLKDLKSVTVFSTAESEEHTVGVIVANEKLDAALVRFKREAGYHTVQVGTHTLHAWSEHASLLDDDGKTGEQYAYILPIAGGTDRLVIVAGKPDALIECLDVVEGRAPSLASGAKITLPGFPGQGAVVFAAAGEPLARLAEVEAASAIVRLAQAWTFELGESGGALYADLWVNTASSEDALRVQQVLQGATALLGLMAGSEHGPKVQPLLAALSFTADGTHMSARFRYDVQRLLELARSLDHESDEDHHVEKKIIRKEKK